MLVLRKGPRAFGAPCDFGWMSEDSDTHQHTPGAPIRELVVLGTEKPSMLGWDLRSLGTGRRSSVLEIGKLNIPMDNGQKISKNRTLTHSLH